MPTIEEINSAKDYLLLRLKAERMAVSSLDTALLSAARRIVEISRRYNIPPESFRFSADPNLQREVRAILSMLREVLYERIEELDTFEDEEDNNFVAPILTEEDHGKTFKQRLAEYVSRWGYELEATIAAAGLEGVKDTKAIESSVKEYLEHPYDNPWIKAHMGEGNAVRLDNIPHYGKGKAIASRAAIALLLTTIVAKGWMQNWARLNGGKRYYFVFRGSSYPCEICDFQCSFPHDAKDTSGLPPYHAHCCCYVVYTDDL